MLFHTFIKIFLFQRQNFVIKCSMKSIEIQNLFLKCKYLQELNVRQKKVKVEIMSLIKWVISPVLSNKIKIVMWVYK